jgi:thymidylate synthase
VILIQLLGFKGKSITINKLALQELKFDFSTVSGLENTKLGLKMKVYEISWYFAGKDNVVIFQNNEQRLLSPYVYKRWEMQWQGKQTENPIALNNCS